MSSVPKLTPKPAIHSHPDTEICPLCEQPIASEQRAEIWTRIKARQQEQDAARAAEVQRQVQQSVKEAIAEQTMEHRQAIGKLMAQLKHKDEEAQKREEKARKETLATARKENEEALRRAREKHTNAEKEKKALAEQIEKLEKGQEKKIEEAVARETKKVRKILAKDKDVALNKTNAKHFEEMQKLQTKMQAVQRQLDKERADSLGDGQEVDIFNDLKEAFPMDKITRIAKGETGADIRHEIIYCGKVCGTILYESKNRMRWANSYATKLRKDQIAAKADHAILATIKFPAGARDVALVENLLVANPRHVVTLARLLRDSTISMHKLRLSGGERDRKRDEVYKFITSQRCAQLLSRQEDVTDSLYELDKKELKQHEKVWKERGTMLRQLEKAQADFRGEIEYIIEG